MITSVKNELKYGNFLTNPIPRSNKHVVSWNNKVFFFKVDYAKDIQRKLKFYTLIM